MVEGFLTEIFFLHVSVLYNNPSVSGNIFTPQKRPHRHSRQQERSRNIFSYFKTDSWMVKCAGIPPCIARFSSP